MLRAGTDVDLTDQGKLQGVRAGRILKAMGFSFVRILGLLLPPAPFSTALLPSPVLVLHVLSRPCVWEHCAGCCLHKRAETSSTYHVAHTG